MRELIVIDITPKSLLMISIGDHVFVLPISLIIENK
jgi:hypothetical protein